MINKARIIPKKFFILVFLNYQFIFEILIWAIPMMMHFKNYGCFKIIAIFDLVVLLILVTALLPDKNSTQYNINDDNDHSNNISSK